jgi:hypothetical protein
MGSRPDGTLNMSVKVTCSGKWVTSAHYLFASGHFDDLLDAYIIETVWKPSYRGSRAVQKTAEHGKVKSRR